MAGKEQLYININILVSQVLAKGAKKYSEQFWNIFVANSMHNLYSQYSSTAKYSQFSKLPQQQIVKKHLKLRANLPRTFSEKARVSANFASIATSMIFADLVSVRWKIPYAGEISKICILTWHNIFYLCVIWSNKIHLVGRSIISCFLQYWKRQN